ncbi:MAG TPA: hypothetical protein VHO24_03665 [Opitutaceae bacterium]|nr:hypothetical protein [Opitutaceae bacterium]
MKRVLLLLLMGFFSLPLFASDTKEVTFWRWFQKNEGRLFAFEKDRERTFDDLAGALKAVHRDLTFEFGPVLPDGRREFVISAGGIKSAFPAVEALQAAAPKMEKWIFVQFRSRRVPINDLEFSGKKIRAKDVHYLLFRDDSPGKVGIMIFMDGYREAERSVFGQMGYLFLDEALGEYDVEMKLGAIEFQARDSKYFERAHPLTELPKAFDDYFANRKK